MEQEKFLNTMTWRNSIVRFIILWALLLCAACVSLPRAAVEVLPDFNAMFERQKGWTGADGAYTVGLSDQEILWLFGDTWYGEVREGRHENATIINNSIAIQRGIVPPHVTVDFYSGESSEAKPLAFFRPSDGRGWFWFYDGIKVSKKLHLFLLQIERTEDPNSFGFTIRETRLASVANPGDPPESWRASQLRIPWQRLSPDGDTIFGSALLRENDFIYIYGTTENITGGVRKKYMILARVPAAKLQQFNQWQFFSSGRWTYDFNGLSRLAGDFANEYSVSYLASLGKYIAVYTANGASKDIVARFASHPWGPWSEPEILYECPEQSWGPDVFCYAAKGHPELSAAPDEIVVTYIASSRDFDKIVDNAGLYRPRFLRVKFSD
jgi:hypothetical protein